MPLVRRSWQVATAFSRALVTRRDPLPRRFKNAFVALGPTYVKLGQMIASSPGLFPAEWTQEFSSLREHVPAFSGREARRIIEAELGVPVGSMFASFDDVPLAAASIAQVHAATLLDGTDVVVKVQRPRLQPGVKDDLRAMRWVAAILDRIPYTAVGSPRAVVEDFIRTLGEEMDFRLEADNMERMRGILRAEEVDDVRVPLVYLDLVSRRVLTMERIDGIRFNDVDTMTEAGIDTSRLLHVAVRNVVEGVLIHGFFHGDLHAGNIRVLADGTFVLLDFGIVGRLTEPVRARLAQYLLAVARNDYPGIVRALRSFGDAVPADADLDALAAEVQRRYEPFVSNGVLMADLGELLETMVRSMVRFRVRMPRDVVLLAKQLLYLEDAARSLAPDMDLLREQQLITTTLVLKYPELGRQMAEALTPGAIGGSFSRPPTAPAPFR